MNRDETKLNGLPDIRFSSIIFLLRLAAIPVKVKKISIIYALYNITVTISNWSMVIGMCVDVYIHRGDFERVMRTMRTLIPFMNLMWIFSNCR
jgi:Na+/alanine symporter